MTYKELLKAVPTVTPAEVTKYAESIGTKAAVIKYQSAHGLTPDGEVGINTWKTMLGV